MVLPDSSQYRIAVSQRNKRTIADDLDVFTELASLALDLDTVVQEFFKVCAIENAVGSGLRVVNDKLVLGSDFSRGDFGLETRTEH